MRVRFPSLALTLVDGAILRLDRPVPWMWIECHHSHNACIVDISPAKEVTVVSKLTVGALRRLLLHILMS